MQMESALVGNGDTDCQVTEANETNFFSVFCQNFAQQFFTNQKLSKFPGIPDRELTLPQFPGIPDRELRWP